MIDHEKKFQSLIGTIKTIIEKINGRSKKKVSIPYRDDKNAEIQQEKQIQREAFQSLIGTIKTEKREKQGGSDMSFNPL